MKVTILIPIFNEENTIIELLKRVNNQKNGLADLEIIIVDDCSTDKSKKLLKENPELYSQLIELDKNLGKGGAVREGLKHSEGDYILFQDGDLEYNPNDYQKIFRMIKKFNADVVIGSRFLSPEYTRVHYYFHRVGNKFITFLFNLLYNTTFTDIYSCYLCFRKDLIDPNKLRSDSWSQQSEILATAVKKSNVYYEVPISYSGRSFEDGKKIKARHTFSVVYMIIKKRIF
ncbi:glycosyltransferase family 2 protein [Candidatus Actinomarina]|jgi:glycosyltransferase involved in cell wall biosynthesis|nr:glycosyltransferase family 2 protein [Candidatus Actinomarina sp.]